MSGTEETGKFSVEPHSKRTLEYLAELSSNNGYFGELEKQTSAQKALTLESKLNLSKGEQVIILHGIKQYKLVILDYNRPYLTGIDKYKRVWIFDISRVTAVSQPAETVLKKVRQPPNIMEKP